MTKDLFSRRSLGLSGGLAVLLAGLAASPALASPKQTTLVDTSACTNPLLSQPFLSAGDSNWYTLAPGESPDNFDGGGWTLTGGAQIVSAQLRMDRPARSSTCPAAQRRSARRCASHTDYPTARTMVRDVAVPGRPHVRLLRRHQYRDQATQHRPRSRQRNGLDAVKPVQPSSWEPARMADGAIHARSRRDDERLSVLQLLRRPTHEGMNPGSRVAPNPSSRAAGWRIRGPGATSTAERSRSAGSSTWLRGKC